MTEQAWYRKTLLIGLLTVLVICITALAIYLWENRPPEPVQINHITKVEYVVNTETVIREVDPYQWQEFTVTGYTADDPAQGTNSTVYTGFDLNETGDLPIAAVDPDIIPLYSIIEIKDVGAFVALDTGGAIKGKRIDILFEDKNDAYQFGVQERLVRVIEKGVNNV